MTNRISLTDEAYDEALRRSRELSESDVGLVIRCSRSGFDLVRDSSGNPVWREFEQRSWQALITPIKSVSASEQNVVQVGNLKVYFFTTRPVEGIVEVSLAAGEL